MVDTVQVHPMAEGGSGSLGRIVTARYADTEFVRHSDNLKHWVSGKIYLGIWGKTDDGKNILTPALEFKLTDHKFIDEDIVLNYSLAYSEKHDVPEDKKYSLKQIHRNSLVELLLQIPREYVKRLGIKTQPATKITIPDYESFYIDNQVLSTGDNDGKV